MREVKPTQKPVPSSDIKDLFFNSGLLDIWATSLERKYIDRFGNCHLTAAGMEWLFKELVEKFKVDMNTAIVAAGYITIDSFQRGAQLPNNELTQRNHILRDETTGEYYRWDGDLPKQVLAGSTPQSTGGIDKGAWVSVGDASLRGDLKNINGSSLVGHGDTTVKEKLDGIEENISPLFDQVGFNQIGRFLNVEKLREHKPVNIGMIVYVASSYSEADDEHHYGGGYFQSFDNSASPVEDDGGIVIIPATGNIAWRRINFTSYDMCFWGVKPDGKTDNAEAITRATDYARVNRVILDAPAGDIHTSETVPIYDNMGIRGQGKAESTVFYKTTNNKIDLLKNGQVALQVDALCAFIPKLWDLTDLTMESFCVHARLENCMFRRLGLTQDNVSEIRPCYGLFLGKSASPIIRQVNIEGGYIGIKAMCVFSGVMEMVAAVQYNGFGYAGVDFSDYRNSIHHMSGTSMDMRLVQVRGYQFGFNIIRLQYSTLIDCTAEEISPISGETISYAFDFKDPYCITMLNCATEFITGGQVRVMGLDNPSFARALKITGYLPIDQQNPVSSTPMFYVDSSTGNTMNVIFDASDLSRELSHGNSTRPIVSGANCKVIVIGCAGEDWQSSGGGVFSRLA